MLRLKKPAPRTNANQLILRRLVFTKCVNTSLAGSFHVRFLSSKSCHSPDHPVDDRYWALSLFVYNHWWNKQVENNRGVEIIQKQAVFFLKQLDVLFLFSRKQRSLSAIILEILIVIINSGIMV